MMTSVANSQSKPAAFAGVPIRNVWHMLVYSWRKLPLLKRWQTDVESAPTLDGLFAKILSNLVRERMRIGLGRSYTSTAQLLNGVRGQIDFDQSVKQLSFQNARAFCHFQTFSPNVLKNQIIRSTLHYLAQQGDFGPDRSSASSLRSQLRRLVRDLDYIDLIELELDTIRKQELERDDHDYRLMLAICNIILQRRMPTQTAGLKNLYAVERDEKFLWRLFEQFIVNFFQLRLVEWTIHGQQKIYWPAEQEMKFLPLMKPDIVIQHKQSGRMFVIDTKFTGRSLVKGRFDNWTFQSEHIFQIYSYLRSQEEESAEHRSATGMLLYPAVGFDLSEQTEIQGHKLMWQTVDLTKPWQDIEAALVQIVK